MSNAEVKAIALQARLQFETARVVAGAGGFPGGPRSEVFLQNFMNYWDTIERRVIELEQLAATQEQEEE